MVSRWRPSPQRNYCIIIVMFQLSMFMECASVLMLLNIAIDRYLSIRWAVYQENNLFFLHSSISRFCSCAHIKTSQKPQMTAINPGISLINFFWIFEHRLINLGAINSPFFRSVRTNQRFSANCNHPPLFLFPFIQGKTMSWFVNLSLWCSAKKFWALSGPPKTALFNSLNFDEQSETIFGECQIFDCNEVYVVYWKVFFSICIKNLYQKLRNIHNFKNVFGSSEILLYVYTDNFSEFEDYLRLFLRSSPWI